MNFQERQSEQGFTLIELLTVVLVIGILSAIAIPIFLNQRNEASMATVKTDLKNAALIMETESLKNNGKYINYLPDYSGFSSGNLISAVKDYSNTEEMCLEGYNSSLKRKLYYSSQDGGLLPEGQACTPVKNGSSYLEMNATKRVTIIEHPSGGANFASAKFAKKSFIEQGYLEENVVIVPSGTLTLADLDNVEVLAIMSQYWENEKELKSLALPFYEKGGKVLVEGNDNVISYFVETGMSKGGVGVSFTPTYNKLSPPFPYSFASDAFGSDSFRCWLTLKNGAVSITESKAGTDTCISMFGASNSSGGQFVAIIYAKTTADSISSTHKRTRLLHGCLTGDEIKTLNI